MPDPALEVDILGGSPLWRGHEEALASALAAAAAAENVSGSVSLLLGDDAAIAALNTQFRGKPGPTNVLSFPPAGPGEGADGFLGDIALAAETIVAEAEFQGKRFEHHAAHLVVHGFLHLLGYDHEAEAAAEAMEARERAILAALGIADPYA
ncbi:MAG: rRNA maturation RNase YbeY [Hyphomonadaceae bacterium]|nr:rRNA maturation RNase YbeY [Hyphomonadaceae bacterium]MBX3510287.1 rRNA maturation RNase YbeY [Hyphomonadaceae bacterium]